MICKLDHIVITTAHLPDCIAFYKALGFEAQEAGGRWELFSGDFKINVHIRGHELEPKAKNVQTGSADVCFEVDGGLLLTQNALKARGLAIELGPVMRHGAKGEMQSIYLRDPDGNLIELCCYK